MQLGFTDTTMALTLDNGGRRITSSLNEVRNDTGRIAFCALASTPTITVLGSVLDPVIETSVGVATSLTGSLIGFRV